MPRRSLAGAGEEAVPAPPAAVRAALLHPATLRALVPGAEEVSQPEPGLYCAVLGFGVGRLRGHYRVELRVVSHEAGHGTLRSTGQDAGQDGPCELVLAGHSAGPLGGGSATAHVLLREGPTGHTRLAWRYEGTVTGPVALAGSTALRLASQRYVRRFFATLASGHFATGAATLMPAREAAAE